MRHLPPTVFGLLEQLDEMYPARCIEADETPSAAHRYAGRRELIDELKERFKATERRATKDALLHKG